MKDFSFYTIGRYPNNVKLTHPCDIRPGEEGILICDGLYFYVYHIIGSGNSKNIYYKSHTVWLLKQEDIKKIPRVGYGKLHPDTRVSGITFNGDISMKELLELVGTLVVLDVMKT